jgi:hypothetical protein
MERTEHNILVVHLAKRAEHNVLLLEVAGLGDELLDSDRCADSLFDCILLRLRSSSMLCPGWSSGATTMIMVGFFGQEM